MFSTIFLVMKQAALTLKVCAFVGKTYHNNNVD